VRQVAQEAQRRHVAVAHVVDRDEQRAAVGEVRRQPVEAVDQREQGGGVGRQALPRGGVEQRGAGGRGAPQKLGPLGRAVARDRREELQREAEREVLLALTATGPQHVQPGPGGLAGRLGQQTRLADAGRALDHHQAPTAAPCVAQRRTEHLELCIALEQRNPFRPDPPSHRAPTLGGPRGPWGAAVLRRTGNQINQVGSPGDAERAGGEGADRMDRVDRIVLELHHDAAPISGRVCPAWGPPQPFTGWTDLFAVLQRTVPAAPCEPGVDPKELA